MPSAELTILKDLEDALRECASPSHPINRSFGVYDVGRTDCCARLPLNDVHRAFRRSVRSMSFAVVAVIRYQEFMQPEDGHREGNQDDKR